MKANDLRDRLQVSLGTAYTLERELGGGGMARVFLAEELRLKRKVVVKVLSQERAAGVSAERFEREIIVAARLSHPSIVPLLAAGESDGVPYYTMPFVEGDSLRARLNARGALPVDEAVRVLRDVARALAYAHEHGTVHRDIKPENVLISGDGAVVTDFGIAKAISAARTEMPDVTNLTQAGMVIGTPAYMAPEQVAGDSETDARADLYAWGCLAYELLAGETPFHGRSTHLVLTAHLTEKPPALEPRCPACPPELTAIIKQCLEKDPDNRPQTAREILSVLDAVVPGPTRSAPHRLIGNNSRLKIGGATVLALLAVAIGTLAVQGRGRNTNDASGDSTLTIRSMAVLPFQNLGGDTTDTYFADGISEDLTTALSKVPGLRLVARNSSFRTGGRLVNLQKAGKDLSVDALLDGTVRRAADQMRLTVRLTRVNDESLLWSERYDRQASDVFAVQDEMARAIVVALQVHLAKASRPVATAATDASAATKRGTTNLDAYDLYMRAQYLLRRRGPGVRQAADMFEQAIRLDPGFARAHSGLSAALELFPYFVGATPASVYDRATASATRALELDSTLAEAHTSMAMAFQHDYQWERAEQEYTHALALNPNDAANRHQYGRFLLYMGRSREALEQFRVGRILDPYSAVISSWVAYNHSLLGQMDSAVAEIRRAIELDSTNASTVAFKAFMQLQTGDKAGARATIDRLPQVLPWLATVAYVAARSGDSASTRRILRDLASKPRQWFTETAIAMGNLGLGDTARGLDALERATAAREIWPAWWPLSDVIFEEVRANARFAELAGKTGLDVTRFAGTTIARPR